jgi:hypothetical protein
MNQSDLNMIPKPPLFPLIFLAGVMVLAGCSSSAVTPNQVPDNYSGEGGPNSESSRLIGSAIGGSDIVLGNSKSKAPETGGAGLGVNAYLWRGALDTLSFMPLASADPFGGVIITDWWQPQSSDGERFKATAYIMGRELRPDAFRLAMYRQVQQKGQWVDATMPQATVSEIENRVLSRARSLRADGTPSS